MIAPQAQLDTGTLSDRVHATLREYILTNQWPPGTPLQEETVGRALGVSRGPVREAVRRLAAEGLVTLVARRGAVVSSLTREEFLHAYQVREALEVAAIRQAVPRLQPEDLARLQQLQRNMVQAVAAAEPEAFFTANADFHALFVDRSGNPILRDIYYPLIDRMRRYRMRSLALRGGMERSCEEHQAIVEAVSAGEAEKAARLLFEHIQIPQRILASTDGDGELELVAHEQRPALEEAA
jgi:DNA-binding GntR family transcriptional regulator